MNQIEREATIFPSGTFLINIEIEGHTTTIIFMLVRYAWAHGNVPLRSNFRMFDICLYSPSLLGRGVWGDVELQLAPAEGNSFLKL